MSSLIGKVVADVEIRASAEKFYGVFCNTPSQLSSICPDVIQACHLLDGEWGRLGSITHWSYVHGPQTLLQQGIRLFKAVDAYLTYA
ncbi:hypothetical protein QUC31_013995 [Theobroma cacao]